MLFGAALVALLCSVSTFSKGSDRISILPPNYDPMTSNYAPDEENPSGEVYLITEQRLKEIRQLFMYPFYDKGGNVNNVGDHQTEIQSSAPEVQKDLSFQLPFFGFRYNYTRVSLNGYLEFSDPPEYNTYPLVFPVKDWPQTNDPSLIGIFLSKCRVGIMNADDVDQRTPGVYFRIEKDLGTRTDRMGVEIRERVKWDIREGIVGASTFDPKHLIIVTWKNVSFAGGFSTAISKTNTFQLVMATDEIFTYAMFNYLNIVWTSHTEAGGDTITGEGGVPAFVGFNAGNGTRSWEYIPYSQSSVIRDLIANGFGNGQKGRHYFRIDENVLAGSCVKGIGSTYLDLAFAPQSGNMLGGSLINITGPCFEPTDVITCKFNSEVEVQGVIIDTNRAICVQPPLSVEGYVIFEVKVGTQNYRWKGNYYVETPATATQTLFFDDTSYNEKNPEIVGITWEKKNLTLNEGAAVSISLWGYSESGTYSDLLYINDLTLNTANSGFYKIITSAYKNRDDGNVSDIQFGFIQVNVTESIPSIDIDVPAETKITRLLWSRPIPLAWYFASQWERKYGSNWPESLCGVWKEFDQRLDNFTNELPDCPCTFEQALANKGRYMSDLDCNRDSNPACYLNRQALHCVITGLPALKGGEQQCCYDKNEYLMLSQDQQWGSNPRRSHNLGYTSLNETRVPTLSQWFNDIMPKFVCCLWQTDDAIDCEAFRYERRPTQDCVTYEGPGTAGIFGDPHIITFDGLNYTFNAEGDFVLVLSKNAPSALQIQGRFEETPVNPNEEAHVTKLTSVVARENSSTVIEIRQRPSEARWRYHLDVFADGRRIYFDGPSLKVQHFPGVTVYTPTYILNQSDIIVMFDSGAGVEVIDNNGFLSAIVYLPQTFFNQTRGLFGNWSSDMRDDFVLPNGTYVATPTSLTEMKRVYTEFGMEWMINDSLDLQRGSSLFFRQYGRTASYYNDRNFVREYRMLPENRTQYIDKSYELCGLRDFNCLYNYAMTYSSDLSENGKDEIEALRVTNHKKIVSCGPLKTPRFGRKSTFLFVPGTIVTFECDQGYVLEGDRKRECLPEGEWNEPEYGFTECLPSSKIIDRNLVH